MRTAPFRLSVQWGRKDKFLRGVVLANSPQIYLIVIMEIQELRNELAKLLKIYKKPIPRVLTKKENEILHLLNEYNQRNHWKILRLFGAVYDKKAVVRKGKEEWI